MGLDVEIELDVLVEDVRGNEELEGQWSLSQQGVQMAEHVCRKAPGQLRPWQGKHLAQVPHAHAPECSGVVGRESDPLHRQVLEDIGKGVLILDAESVIDVRQHACSDWVGRQGYAMAKAQRAQFATQAGLELRPGAEQSQRRLHL